MLEATGGRTQEEKDLCVSWVETFTVTNPTFTIQEFQAFDSEHLENMNHRRQDRPRVCSYLCVSVGPLAAVFVAKCSPAVFQPLGDKKTGADER